MKTIKFKHEFLVFLYAYLRHIDLSLDRSRWGSWAEYRAYACCQVSPLEIYNYLNYDSLNHEDDTVMAINEHSYSKIRLTYFWNTFTGRNNFLTSAEINYIRCILNKYTTYLNADFEQYNRRIEELRIEIARFYSSVLESKLSRCELDKVMRVEHFLQNPVLNTTTLSSFSINLYSDWLKNFTGGCAK